MLAVAAALATGAATGAGTAGCSTTTAAPGAGWGGPEDAAAPSLSAMQACPVDLLNLIDLQRAMMSSPAAAPVIMLAAASSESSSRPATGVATGCAASLQCSLVRAVLPAVTSSTCNGPVVGAESLGNGCGSSTSGGSGASAGGGSGAAAGGGSSTPPRDTARYPLSLVQRLEALLDACASELALFTALQLAARSASASKGAEGQVLVEAMMAAAAALAACPPLTQEAVDACLAQRSRSRSSGGSSDGDGGLGPGPALTFWYGAQCVPAAAAVPPEVWSLTSLPSGNRVASRSSGAIMSGGGGITWRAGCSCAQDWEPVCDQASGQQYPNACYARCLGVAGAVGPCSRLLQPTCSAIPARAPSPPASAAAATGDLARQQNSLTAYWRRIFSARGPPLKGAAADAGLEDLAAEALRRPFLAHNAAHPPPAVSVAPQMAQSSGSTVSGPPAIFAAVDHRADSSSQASPRAPSAADAVAAGAVGEPIAAVNDLLAELLQPVVELLVHEAGQSRPAGRPSSSSQPDATTSTAGGYGPADTLARRLHLLYLLSAAAAEAAEPGPPGATSEAGTSSVASGR
ncbi:hypothetical protein HYH02_010142 [Chlamydomonas schloesseri]|uniref:Kazal-like domain-containing protein n=1 Tax=Chlamydomonas schloesseri TaxID=2026947 RepID=A0A835T8C1_9CHLO|nr:hypothetical protein HYH02_010142 [Chlamydomonas schloesseri]|eukprot:KAG2440558.1 hypothetical protein HYH02_010142 [Chlamydomonas schloesseri]